MTRVKELGKSLSGEKTQMITHRKLARLRMQVINRSIMVATTDQPERLIIDQLELINQRLSIVRIDDRRGIIYNGLKEALMGYQQTLLVFAELRVRQSAKNI